MALASLPKQHGHAVSGVVEREPMPSFFREHASLDAGSSVREDAGIDGPLEQLGWMIRRNQIADLHSIQIAPSPVSSSAVAQ